MIPENVSIIEYKVSENRNVFFLKYNKKYDSSICFATYSIPGMIQTDIASNNRSIWMHRRVFRYTSEVKKNI